MTVASEVRLAWGWGAAGPDAQTDLPWARPDARDVGVVLPHAAAAQTDQEVAAAWRWGSVLPDAMVGMPWDRTSAADTSRATSWTRAGVADASRAISWLWAGVVAERAPSLPWRTSLPADRDGVVPWLAAVAADGAVPVGWRHGSALDGSTTLPWGVLATVGVMAERVLPWSARPPRDRPVRIVWIIIKRSTLRMPTLTLTKVATSEVIPLLAAEASIDLDSWAWEVRATLATQAGADKLRPDGAGPVEVALAINGHLWRALIEEIEIDRQFASATWHVAGRSPSALLDAPYAPLQTRQWGSAILARQIIADELDGTDWSEDWGIADWNIPAGLFSVTDKSAMEIMTTIAKACGGLVQSHPSDRTLHFRYRYPVSPGDWGTAPVAATLSDALLFRQAERFSPQPRYDAVVVSGQDQGVVVQVKRSGEPGLTMAPQKVDPLILTVGVARERDRNILDALGYDKSVLDREMPLAASPGEPGLRLPGDLIEIAEPAETWRGMVTATAVSARMGGRGEMAVTQHLTIERAWT